MPVTLEEQIVANADNLVRGRREASIEDALAGAFRLKKRLLFRIHILTSALNRGSAISERCLVSRELTIQYSLAPDVNLRFEPQYYESYVAFNYKTASTTFLTADEHGVLEYIRRKPASPEDISTARGN
jgi:hypothetical protein